MPRLRSRLWWAERSSPSSSCLRTAAAQSGRTRKKVAGVKSLHLFESLFFFYQHLCGSDHRNRPQQCWTESPSRGMASAVFEGTSLVNMFVRDCWVNGIRRLIISQRGEEEEFFEIRTEWSDRNILYLHRSYSDLGRLFKRLVESFPEDRGDLSKCPLIEGGYEGEMTGMWQQEMVETLKTITESNNATFNVYFKC